MAKILNQPSMGFSTSSDFLSKYNDLLRKKKQGSVLQGFDTSSAPTFRLEGKPVENASGIGQNAAYQAQQYNPQDNFVTPETVAQGGTPDEGMQLLLALLQMNNLTPEQEQQRAMLLDMFGQDQIEKAMVQLGDQGQTGGGLGEIPVNTGTGLETGTNTGQGVQTTGTNDSGLDASHFSINRITPASPQPGDPNFVGPVRPAPQGPAPQPGDMGFIGPIAPTQDQFSADTSALNQYEQNLAGEQASNDQINNTSLNQLLANAPTPNQEQMNGYINERGQQVRAQQAGLPLAQIQQSDAIPSSVTQVIDQTNPFRKSVGDAVANLGNKLHLPEMNISESITGPTGKILKTVADAGSKMITPTPAYAAEGVPQAGQGLQKIRQEFSGSQPSGIQGRPAMENLSPTPRAIGSQGGLQDVAGTLASNSLVNQPQAQMDAEGNVITPAPRPTQASRSVSSSGSSSSGGSSSGGSSSSSPSRPSSSSSSASTASRSTSTASRPASAPAPRPAPTPAPRSAPAPVYGVVRPATTSTPPRATPVPTPTPPRPSPAPTPSTSIFQSIINALFGRRR